MQPADLDLARPLHGLGKVIGCLETEPGVGPTAECLVQPNGHLRRNPRMAVHEVGKLLAADAKLPRRLGDAQPQGPKAILSHRQARMRRILHGHRSVRSEEHTSELQSLMRISYAVFCLKKKKTQQKNT